MKRRLFYLLLPVLLLSCSGRSDRAGETPESGFPFQSDVDFAAVINRAVFTDLNGNEVRIENYRGKALLIDFWETWCGPCLQVFPSLQQLREEYPDHFDVLAVNLGMVDSADDAREFRDRHGYDFHFLVDAHGVSGELGIFSIPFKVYVDPEGNFVRHSLGSKGTEGDYEDALEFIRHYLN